MHGAVRSLISQRRRRGVLLLELMLAVAVTSIMAVGLVSLLAVTAHGTSTRNDMQESFVRLGLLTARINASIRGSGMVLAKGNDYLLLWTADLRADGVPNLSELRLLERDTGTGDFGQSVVAFSSGLTEAELEALDTPLPLTTDFNALVGQLKTNSQFIYTLWATNISQWSIALDDPTVLLASAASYRLTLAAGKVTETAISSARLRNQ